MKFEIFKNNNDKIIPLFLDSTSINLGVLSSFDGNISQINEIVNFTYTFIDNVLTIYNSVNVIDNRYLLGCEFWLTFPDNSMMQLPSPDVNDSSLKTAIKHDFQGGIVTLSLTLPTGIKTIEKYIENSEYVYNPTTFGEVIYNLPFNEIEVNQKYLDDVDSGKYINENSIFYPYTGNTIIKYVAMSSSRIEELKKYGSDEYDGVSITTININNENIVCTGYTIDDLNYFDLYDGTTIITGSTSNFTKEDFFYVFNNEQNKVEVLGLTRNEFFLCFIEEPQVYSDVYIDREKADISEMNFRLSEIDNLGELETYGNGYFTIKKQN
jgi:hypothetical protein